MCEARRGCELRNGFSGPPALKNLLLSKQNIEASYSVRTDPRPQLTPPESKRRTWASFQGKRPRKAGKNFFHGALGICQQTTDPRSRVTAGPEFALAASVGQPVPALDRHCCFAFRTRKCRVEQQTSTLSLPSTDVLEASSRVAEGSELSRLLSSVRTGTAAGGGSTLHFPVVSMTISSSPTFSTAAGQSTAAPIWKVVSGFLLQDLRTL